jgi:antirestriction protein ArdC
MNEKFDIYKMVTDQIISLMDSGRIPWNEPYLTSGEMPRNLVSNKEYRGINRWLLWKKFESPYYISFKQVNELGGRIKKGEHGSVVVWWNVSKVEDKETKEIVNRYYLRYYRVWNVSQCEGLKHKRLTQKDNGNEELIAPKEIVANMPNRPEIKSSNKGYAYYVPTTDKVHIGSVKQFKTSEAYHATLFHELIHSTGHSTRLDRELNGFSETTKQEYSREELVAEFGSAFLCEVSGISKPTIKNAAAYIQHWKSFLESDSKAVVLAASRAEKAADYILHRENEENGEAE